MSRKVKNKENQARQRFTALLEELEAKPDCEITQRHLRILGHECPDTNSFRERLFEFLESRGARYCDFPDLLATKHSVYCYVQYAESVRREDLVGVGASA